LRYGERDIVNCGQDENDRATVDAVDELRSCEQVRVVE